jgi:hypothetical protein
MNKLASEEGKLVSSHIMKYDRVRNVFGMLVYNDILNSSYI